MKKFNELQNNDIAYMFNHNSEGTFAYEVNIHHTEELEGQDEYMDVFFSDTLCLKVKRNDTTHFFTDNEAYSLFSTDFEEGKKTFADELRKQSNFIARGIRKLQSKKFCLSKDV